MGTFENVVGDLMPISRRGESHNLIPLIDVTFYTHGILRQLRCVSSVRSKCTVRNFRHGVQGSGRSVLPWIIREGSVSAMGSGC